MNFQRYRRVLFILALVFSVGVISLIKAEDCPGTTKETADQTFTTTGEAGVFEFDVNIPNASSSEYIFFVNLGFAVCPNCSTNPDINRIIFYDNVPAIRAGRAQHAPGWHHIKIVEKTVSNPTGYSYTGYIDDTIYGTTTNNGRVIELDINGANSNVTPVNWEIKNFKWGDAPNISPINCFSSLSGYMFTSKEYYRNSSWEYTPLVLPDSYKSECSNDKTIISPFTNYSYNKGFGSPVIGVGWRIIFSAIAPPNPSQPQSVLGNVNNTLKNLLLVGAENIKIFAQKQPVVLTIIIVFVITITLSTIFYIKKRKRNINDI